MAAHETRAHSRLGASSSERWLACPASVRLSVGIPNTSSEYAREGTAAHELGEWCLKNGKASRYYPQGTITVEGFEIEITEEMQSAVDLYVGTVRASIDPGSTLIVEQKFSLASIHPALFGTCDAAVYTPSKRTLKSFDLKFGAGKAVEAAKGGKPNPQLQYYAIGAMLANPDWKVDEIELVIVQPRAPHPKGPVRRHTLDAMDLMEFASELAEGAKRTEAPDAKAEAGDHCRFCPAAGICPTLRQQAIEKAQIDFEAFDAGEPLPNPAEMSLNRFPTHEELDLLRAWLKAVEDRAFSALSRGERVPGWKLVQKRPMRRWKNELDALNALKELGLAHQDIVSEKVVTPAQAEKLLKKRKGAISDLTVSASSGVTLAAESDPREAVAAGAAAAVDAFDAI